MKLNLYFISAVLSAGLGVSFVGSAYAITSDSFIYQTRRYGYYSISPAAFSPESDTIKYEKLFGLRTYLQNLTDTPANNTSCFNAGVNLPQGATITGVVYWYDNNPLANSSQPAFGLLRHSLVDGSSLFLAALGSSTGFTGRTYRMAATTPSVVNNVNYTYAAKICLGWLDLFYGARIDYTYTSAGD